VPAALLQRGTIVSSAFAPTFLPLVQRLPDTDCPFWCGVGAVRRVAVEEQLPCQGLQVGVGLLVWLDVGDARGPPTHAQRTSLPTSLSQQAHRRDVQLHGVQELHAVRYTQCHPQASLCVNAGDLPQHSIHAEPDSSYAGRNQGGWVPVVWAAAQDAFQQLQGPDACSHQGLLAAMPELQRRGLPSPPSHPLAGASLSAVRPGVLERPFP